MKKIVLLRHGESIWNGENRFTGWADVDLTEKGVAEAKKAGELMRNAGLVFDLAHTSVLKRAIKTLWLALEQLDLMWIPVRHSWRLNERHNGALEGLNKAETTAKFGEAQVLAWRRGFDTTPPAISVDDPRHPGSDPRYRGLPASQVPLTECLKDTVARVLPYWNQSIAPDVRAGKRILIATHENSLRALVKHLDKISDHDIIGLNIPNGVPLVYELDDTLKPIRHYYLSGAAEGEESMQTVAG